MVRSSHPIVPSMILAKTDIGLESVVKSMVRRIGFRPFVVAADPYSDLAVLRFEKEAPLSQTLSAATSDPDRNDQIAD